MLAAAKPGLNQKMLMGQSIFPVPGNTGNFTLTPKLQFSKNVWRVLAMKVGLRC